MKRNAETGLTIAEADFIAAYLSLKPPSGAEAYRRLHPNANDETAKREAKRFLARPHVAAFLAKLQAKALDDAGCTFAQHLRDLRGLRDAATRLGEFSVAIRAEELRGRASGHYVERSRVDVSLTQELVNAINVADLSDEELAEVRSGKITPDLINRLTSLASRANPSRKH